MDSSDKAMNSPRALHNGGAQGVLLNFGMYISATVPVSDKRFGATVQVSDSTKST
ncbi:hypothetical protein DPMN_109074 [Dreissena polymorpha]|uniref:Uncharacterized protein n=1 Tax=Dreissena polymorpha TaxID=45954 RepID=A0A9D4KA40_DREPO|nr:hypothetical protein DPMN_109074 [Dreissena polymorpha]